jgi:anaerobic selenocysteine-containing dehydrogenase
MGELSVIVMIIHQMSSTLVLTSWCRWVSLNHRDRLKYPLIRRNGKLERASWDEAMSLIVDKTQEIRTRLTNHGVGFYTSGQLFLEEYYVLAMVGKAGLNTLHMCDIRDKRRILVRSSRKLTLRQGWQYSSVYRNGCGLHAGILR